eukprot:1786886-Prymnesium_polylepis.1
MNSEALFAVPRAADRLLGRHQTTCRHAVRPSLCSGHTACLSLPSLPVVAQWPHLLLNGKYKELVETGRGTSIAPQNLLRRVLMKGKVKQLTNDVSRARTMSVRLRSVAVSSSAAAASIATSAAKPVTRSAAGLPAKASLDPSSCSEMRDSTPEESPAKASLDPSSCSEMRDSTLEESPATASLDPWYTRKSNQAKPSSAGKTDEVYAGYLSLRSVPIE